MDSYKPSSEQRRGQEEAQRNLRRRHDWWLRWIETRPLADHLPAIPAAMGISYHSPTGRLSPHQPEMQRIRSRRYQ